MSKEEKIEEEEKIPTEENDVKTFIKFLKELLPYVIILVAVVVIRTYFFTPIMVNGPSMQPTLNGGEIMILNKKGKIDRFDIVVVDIGTEDIIKRVIAMPNETISCEDGVVYVNGHKQEEDYSKGNTSDFELVKLGDDEYFVMGDNRENSLDSRKLGTFKKEQIKGTTSLVLFPFNRIGNLK